MIDSLLGPLAISLLEQLSEGVVLFDRAGTVIFANGAARRMLGGVDLGRGRAPALVPRLVAQGGRRSALGGRSAGLAEVVIIPPGAAPPPSTLAEHERAAIVSALEATGWKLAETARRLGISRTTLWRRIRAYGLSRRAP